MNLKSLINEKTVTNTLHLMVGIPGSGKSTYIKSKLADKILICPDDIREELTGDASDQSQNALVWDTAYKRLHQALQNGKDVVFDATMVDKRSRKQPIKVARKYGVAVHAVAFPIDVSVAIDRQNKRDRKVSVDVIQRFADRFVLPSKSEGFETIVVVK
jgi:predicted kinase